MANGDLGMKAEIEYVVTGVSQAVSEIRRLQEVGVDSADDLESVARSLEKIERASKRAAGGTKDEAAALRQANAAWDKQDKIYNSYLKSQEQATTSLISQRYALYDVASTYGVLSAALLGASAYAIKVGADFESAFTNVERTSEGTIDQIAGLRDALIEMSTQIPLSFEELSSIAALGNQLGIAAEDVEGFTGTIARFAAISGVSAEQVAESFGKLSNLTGLDPSQYENLGAAIAYVARSSASTEKNILSTSKEIAAIADSAGFSAQAIVGLSGALASLSLAPEKSRGALSIYFSTLEKSVAAGGKQLQNFATVVGVTAEELDAMVRGGQGQEVFQGFLEGLKDLDNVAKTTALDDLGLSAVRVDQTFKALSGNTQLVNDSFAQSERSFAEGAELARQYAIVVDDLNSRWMIFVNSVNALIEALSGGLVPSIGAALGGLTDIIIAATEFASSPIGEFVGKLVLSFGTLLGLFFLYKSGVALATASTYALITAQQGLAKAGAVGGIRGLIGALAGYTGTATVATGATYGLRAALVSARAAAVGLLSALGPLAFAPIDKVNVLGTKFGSQAFDQAQKAVAGVTNALTKTEETGTKAGNSGAAGMAKIGKAAGGAAKQVRTLVDYGNDLSEVFKRAFDIRFSGQQGLDGVNSGWSKIRQSIADANEEIREHRQNLLELTADKAVKEYFLSIAETYGNTLQAGKLRAELAGIDNDLIKTQKKLSDAQGKSTKTLVGNSDAAIENRAEIYGLVGNYQDYITSLANSGLSQKELTARVATAKAEFLAQAQALGYNRAEVLKISKSFDDMAIAIKGVPRNITVAANTQPALQALNEYLAKVRAASAAPSLGNASAAKAAGARDGNAYGKGFSTSAGAAASSAAQAVAKAAADAAAKIIGKSSGGGGGGGGTGGYASGGYTGNIGANKVAGVVHGNEFVFDSQATKKAGVQNLYALQSQLRSGSVTNNNFASTSSVSNSTGGGIMELGPKSLGVLRAAVGREMAVYLGDVDVAKAAARGNKQLQGIGAN